GRSGAFARAFDDQHRGCSAPQPFVFDAALNAAEARIPVILRSHPALAAGHPDAARRTPQEPHRAPPEGTVEVFSAIVSPSPWPPCKSARAAPFRHSRKVILQSRISFWASAPVKHDKSA